MQSTVIVLQGRGNSGKTTTIRHVWKVLNARSGVNLIKNRRYGKGYKEIKGAILEVDGVLVGFMSKSEPASDLWDYLNELIGAGCLVLVCATRSAGGSVEVVERLRERGWRIRTTLKDRNEAEDQDRAEEIVEEVLSAVK